MIPIKAFSTQPLFLLGLVLRLVLIFLFMPEPVSQWYIPFLNTSIGHFTLDPWASWLSQNGSLIAFPYGYMMWLTFLPFILLSKLFGLPLFLGYSFTLLFADFSLLSFLRKIQPCKDHLLLITYWLSPIILFATYILGLNDLIPTLFLVISLYCIRNLKLFFAGVFCVIAISAKLSMLIALPFFFIYLLRNNSMRQLLPAFMKGLILATVIFILPFSISSSGVDMLLNNPKLADIYNLSINIHPGLYIYIIPLIFIVILYLAWRVRRINFELFQSVMGVAFLLIVTLTPSSPGWFIWTVPLLVLYQTSSDRIAIILCAIFSFFYVLSNLMSDQIFFSFIHSTPLDLTIISNSRVSSLCMTLMSATSLILGLRIWHEKVKLNDYFRLSRKPFSIGIAGDSGAGKDTFCNALTGLFGHHSVASLSGDDYHLWDRHKPMWQIMTHLNPMANDLDGFTGDLFSLIDGRTIYSQHYNHETGKMSHPRHIKSNDFVIATGLHALYSSVLRNCYDAKIYLDIDENLRYYFKLRRDILQRGHSKEQVFSSLKKREADSIRFIHPQAKYADLVLTLQPAVPFDLDNIDAHNNMPKLKLLVCFTHGLNELDLTRVLVGVCGLHLDRSVTHDPPEVRLTIEGEIQAEDIKFAASLLCSHILNFLDLHPKWQDGMLGLMQLITLCYINQILMKRIL